MSKNGFIIAEFGERRNIVLQYCGIQIQLELVYYLKITNSILNLGIKLSMAYIMLYLIFCQILSLKIEHKCYLCLTCYIDV